MNIREIALGCLMACLALTAFGQQSGGQQTGGQQGGGGNASGSASRPSVPGRINDPEDIPRPFFFSGKVMLADGATPKTDIKIERVCNGNARVEGYADSRGNFNIELGRNAVFQDASVHSSPDPSLGPTADANRGGATDPLRAPSPDAFGRGGVTQRELRECDLRASLPGYRSDQITLANRRFLDNPDVGIIVLRPIAKTGGMLLSATSALAPKDAKKAYGKAMDALKKRNQEEAQANLEKATTIYPRYAEAWFEMGKLFEQRQQPADARRAYGQALDADSKFLPPYERLSAIAMRESKWQEAADVSEKLLRLDPSTYPNVYYMAGVAHLQLQHFDQAEKNARELIRLDPAKKFVQGYYILGLAQASQGNFKESIPAMKTFLASPPAGMDLEAARKQLSQMEEAAQQQGARAQQ